MKMYALSFLLVFSNLTSAGEEKSIEFLAKVKTVGSSIELILPNKNEVIPSLLDDKKLGKVLLALLPGDEVLVRGHVIYQAHRDDSRTSFHPVFVIETMRPISLRLLGKVDRPKIDAQTSSAIGNDHHYYRPPGIPVSTEVASAITMTALLLMMQSLTTSATQLGAKEQLNSGLFIFAGALATGVFIYEQVTGHDHKKL